MKVAIDPRKTFFSLKFFFKKYFFYLALMTMSKRQISIKEQELKSGWKKCKVCGKYKKLEKYTEIRVGAGTYKTTCKECLNIYRRQWYADNIDELKERSAKHYILNREKLLARSNDWKRRNPEKVKELQKNARQWSDYTEFEKQRHNKNCRAWRKKKSKEDPLFNLQLRLRGRIRVAFKHQGYKKTTKTAIMLGCDFKTVYDHLESQFTEGMNWENRSEWHIDHIKPLAQATNEEELRELCHYTNLQPLWAEDNLRKGDKWEE